jgi:hypothetical protein
MSAAAAPVVAGFLIGALAGFPAGMLYSGVRRSWADVETAKATVPKARKAAWGRTRQTALLTFLLVLTTAAILGAYRHP